MSVSEATSLWLLPAFKIRMSMLPNALITDDVAAANASASVTSNGTIKQASFLLLTSMHRLANVSNLSTLLADIATLAPALANCNASDSPIPNVRVYKVYTVSTFKIRRDYNACVHT